MRRLLLRDDLVSNDTLLACKRAMPSDLYSSSRLIYALGQPFYLRFRWNFKLWIINTSGDKESTVDMVWVLPRTNKCRLVYPSTYTQTPYSSRKMAKIISDGSAICCFELSKLPEHEGTRSIVIRVLKVVEPTIRTPQDVLDLHLPEIVEGGLLMKNMTEVIRYEVPEDEKRIHVLDKWGLRYLKEYPEAVGSFWPPSP
ncbi:hypothetical protein PHLCEN_2v2703 [Hermanssonia centrifuga]|uniref:Uncharacterized protein n=1 Tax=Hermanssonia centrifuga TaxID=98765 RepID=A0A2R6RIE9_9APHY|nr:hypothetical protein PHLCEN_2v2703 [Hermanssonia centrifuga]